MDNIVKLFEEHIENNLKSKLTWAHIDLTVFSLMKVNLAALVFSRKVGEHLQQEYGDWGDSLKIKLVFFNGTPPHFVHFGNKIIPAKYEKKI